jgi:CheY-like chemotaxis protein
MRPWILIVEDNQALREVLRFALEDAEYPVAEAADGHMALDVLRSSSQRMIVLLDLLMPHLGGAGVLHAVAADPHLATYHAYVLMTVSPQPLAQEVVDLLPNLPVQVLQKPFELDVLLDTVDQLARGMTLLP